MIAYWGEGYNGKRHIVHQVNAGYPGKVWVSLCGLWSRNPMPVHKAYLPANCGTCLRVIK